MNIAKVDVQNPKIGFELNGVSATLVLFCKNKMVSVPLMSISDLNTAMLANEHATNLKVLKIKTDNQEEKDSIVIDGKHIFIRYNNKISELEVNNQFSLSFFSNHILF